MAPIDYLQWCPKCQRTTMQYNVSNKAKVEKYDGKCLSHGKMEKNKATETDRINEWMNDTP